MPAVLDVKFTGCFLDLGTFGGSFSTVSKPQIVMIDAFFSIFLDLHEYPFESVEICKPSHKFSKFSIVFQKFVDVESVRANARALRGYSRSSNLSNEDSLNPLAASQH